MNGVSLITGSSHGIGRGIALEIAQAGGLNLVINYAGNEAAARDTAEQCRTAGASRVEVQGDVASRADRVRMIDFVGRAVLAIARAFSPHDRPGAARGRRVPSPNGLAVFQVFRLSGVPNQPHRVGEPFNLTT